MSLLLLFACSDYSFSDPEDALKGSNVGGPDDTGDGEDGDGDPPRYDTPPTERPPTFLDGDCEEGTDEVVVEFSEIYVKSWDATLSEGTLYAYEAGWYHLYDLGMAESGASQTNETAMVRIKNSTNPDGLPAWANCDTDWFVIDADNYSPPSDRIYTGTYWLDEGVNQLELVHFCPVYRAGACGDLHITDWSDSTCETSNPNSVHLVGDAACVVPAG